MRWPSPPFFVILAPRPFRWSPCLELTTDSDRDVFQTIAARLVDEFGGEIVERYGGDGPADKEYWWIDIESNRYLLMRKDGMGIGLMGERWADIELIVRIARRFDARFVGWRWKLWRLLRRV